MDLIKEAFSRAKKDISDLKSQLNSLQTEILHLKSLISSLQTNEHTNTPTHQHTHPLQSSTPFEVNPTEELTEPYKYPLNALKQPISSFSTGNEGVPTDRQTDQQTDRHINLNLKTNFKLYSNSTSKLSETLSSLDAIKLELKSQFKSLTKQEILVFTTLYQFENEGFIVDYPLLASKLSLSESSIRDYVLKIIKKGIQIQKIKENNKKIILKIPSELKQMASLNTILALKKL